MKRVFIAIVAVCGWNLVASPIDDLTSLSSEAREAAAKILRATYIPPAQTNWDSLLAMLKPGDEMTNVEAILRARGFKPGPEVGFQLLVVQYRLDQAWLLSCSYCYQGQYRGKEVLYDRNLMFSPEWRPVAYPSNYTGIWVENYINGQKCLETSLRNGMRWGDRTCYEFQNGRIVYVEHYDPKNPAAEKTDYYGSDGSITRTENSVPHIGKPIK
jgi:hypothetical protein